MKKNFLGKGLGFPLRVTNRGELALSEGEQSISESIRLIIGTAPGERVMRPDFGCRIHEIVFHPNNPSTASLAGYYIQEALVKWEPRIRQVKVEAYPDPTAENVLQLSIRYQIITTNNVKNMVYPFYLRREEVL